MTSCHFSNDSLPPVTEGLKQLESDAIAKGKPAVQGTKTFYRHVLLLSTTLDSTM
jgi:hypothetical protein